jgi:hypothetical protein
MAEGRRNAEKKGAVAALETPGEKRVFDARSPILR